MDNVQRKRFISAAALIALANLIACGFAAPVDSPVPQCLTQQMRIANFKQIGLRRSTHTPIHLTT